MSLQPAHSHQALATLLAEAAAKHGPRDIALLSSLTIKGPPVSQFQLTPAMELESPLIEIAGLASAAYASSDLGSSHSGSHQGSNCLHSLSIIGSMSNSLYRQLNLLLRHKEVGRSLTRLRIENVHPWSRVMTAAEV
jgi:hypothetical protein